MIRAPETSVNPFDEDPRVADGPRFFTDADVRRVLDVGSALAAAEQAFLNYARPDLPGPGRIDAALDGGEFHVKTGSSPGVFAVKANSAFFSNPPDRPAIQGVVLLFDLGTGAPLAVIQSASLTSIRTAAATAAAARVLSRDDSRTVALVGGGAQALAHARALIQVRPIDRFVVWSRTTSTAERLASALRAETDRDAEVSPSAGAAASGADIVVTATPAEAPLLRSGDVAPGTFIAAIGADSPTKQELDPALVARAALITDLTPQCAGAGELHHALKAGLMTVDDVRAELGQVLAGQRAGRLRYDEVVVYDSTGTGFQDAAAGAKVLANAAQQRLLA